MNKLEEKKINALKKASEKIIELKKELAQAKQKNSSEPLAVIGVGCHFPGGAHSAKQFWDHLEMGVESICDVPKDRWDHNAYFSPNRDEPGKINSKYGGFLESDPALFDADFFGISPAEASAMDPQQRLLLEVTWQALEHSGICPKSLQGELGGVYVGTATSDYGHLLAKNALDADYNVYYGPGNSSSVLSGRISYLLGLNGPAIACDTACSSSLVAVDLACKALSSGEINIAIAGGVNLIFSPQNSIFLSKAHLLSEDGHCKTFDEKADGYARGEGCGTIIIKRLQDAIDNNDDVMCLIKSSAVNHNGDSSSLMVPKASAQAQVMKKALDAANLTHNDIDVIEAHGLGTSLGDSIEMDAISRVFSIRERPLSIGSVKTNIGHLEGAAGIAAMIKMILSLKNNKIPKHLNFTTLNPLIDLRPFKGEIPCSTQAWPQESQKTRRAGISSFGLSGTNAHVILEESPHGDVVNHAPSENYLFCFSAKSQDALDAYLDSFYHFLNERSSLLLHPADMSFTLAACRDQYAHRALIITGSLKQLKKLIKMKRFFKPNPYAIKENLSLETQKAIDFYNGQHVNFDELFNCSIKKIPLPTYAFQRQRYWQPCVPDLEMAQTFVRRHPLLKNQVENHRHHELLYTTLLSSTHSSFLSDHQVFEKMVVASATHLSMLISYLLQILKKDESSISNIRFKEPLILNNKRPTFLQLCVSTQRDDFEIVSYKQEGLANHTTHVTGSFTEADAYGHSRVNVEKINRLLTLRCCNEQYIKTLEKVGFKLGPNFHCVENVSYNDTKLLATLQDAMESGDNGYDVWPGMLDACFKLLTFWLNESASIQKVFFLETIKTLVVRSLDSAARYVFIKKKGETITHIDLLDESGNVLLTFSDITLKEISNEQLKISQAQQHKSLADVYKVDWIHLPDNSFDTISADNETVELLVISPSLAPSNQFKEALEPLVLHVANELPSSFSTKHVLYFYPHHTDPESIDALYSLHQCVQTLLRTSSIESIGVLVEPSLNARVVEGYWKTLCLEHQEKNIYLIESHLHDGVLLADVIKAQCKKSCGENHIAIRDGVYYAPRLLSLAAFEKKHHPTINAFDSTFKYKSNKTYLLTAGTGSLGKRLVHHLVTQGVRSLVLVDSESFAETPHWLTALEIKGIDIKVVAAKVSNVSALNIIIHDINSSKTPLAGIFHLAGKVNDKSISALSEKDFELMFEEKITGALVLHQLTKSLQLDCFVMFSSIAASFGSPGQAHYAAANGFLDALCSHRKTEKLPALSINWGPIMDKAQGSNQLTALQASGLSPLNSLNAFVTMDQLLTKPYEHAIVADFKWQQITALVKHTKFLDLLDEKNEKRNFSFITQLKNTVKEKRSALLSSELKGIVSDSFSVRHGHEIHEHKEFMELGVDSLMTITLWNRLQAMVGPDQTLSKEMLMECTSVSKLSEYLKETVFHDYFDVPARVSQGVAPVNEIESIALPVISASKFDSMPKDISKRKTNKEKNNGAVEDILITGATGGLGGYLVKLLLEDTKVTLHCLIRSKSSQEGLERLINVLKTYRINPLSLNSINERVKIYCGDVSCDHLSLTYETYYDLAGMIDLTLHAAAKISLGSSYEELYETNVLGTKNIIEFSLKTSAKSLLYVSSYCVMGDMQIKKHVAFKESDFDLGQNFHDMGYQRTKFESERAIRNAKKSGLNWRIVRPGNLFGESVDGTFPLNLETTPSIFYDLLKTIIETKTAFLSPLYFDITPVDYVAKAIEHIIFSEKAPFETYHLTNPEVKTFSSMIKILCELGFPIDVIDLNDYVKRIYSSQLKHNGKVYQSLTTSLIQYRAKKVIPVHSTPVNANKTQALLARKGIVCPKITKKLLNTLLSYCQKERYIAVNHHEIVT